MYQIKFTSLAEKDLNSSYDYIYEVLKNPHAAENLVLETEHTLSKISDMPYSCSMVSDPYLKKLGIRFLPIQNYVAFFIIEEDFKEIIVLRFLYGKREWTSLLKEKSES